MKYMMKRTATRKGEAGLTLIEVLASMVLLTLGILAMAPMFVLSITGNQHSNRVTSLATEAQLEIENQIAQGTFATMPYVNYTTEYNGRYAIMTYVNDNTTDPSVPNNVYEIKVLVYWYDDANVSRNMEFSTYASKP
jgi:Tfp pilus assembly protein PilV